MSDLFNTGIRPAVDAYLKAKSEEQRDYGDYWSASSAGYCPRLVIMRRLGIPKVPEIKEDWARTTRVFEVGHVFHSWVQDITKQQGTSIAQEVELEDQELKIRGHFDDLVLVDGKLILYDIKTAHSASFNYSKNRPMGHYHSMQLGTYMYLLRKMPTPDYAIPFGGNHMSREQYEMLPDLQEARILSISKDDLRMDEKQLLWSEDLEQKILDYWNQLNVAWNEYQLSGALPECTCLQHDGGFMGRRSAKGKIYGDFFYNDEPCSQKWFDICREKGLVK